MNYPTLTLLTELRRLANRLAALIAQTAQMGTGVVDTIMAARFGDKDLAAIAIGFNIWLPLYLVVLGVIFASSTIIAQDFGAGRIQRVSETIYHNLMGVCVSQFNRRALVFLRPPDYRGLASMT